jgi:AcrR family transcriptional regulator
MGGTGTGTGRRTQAQRRAAPKQAVLESACRLFGEKGYADTSLEEIAEDCGLTIRPIYHYFGNNKALFAAVNDVMAARIVASIKTGEEGAGGADIVEHWRRPRRRN